MARRAGCVLQCAGTARGAFSSEDTDRPPDFQHPAEAIGCHRYPKYVWPETNPTDLANAARAWTNRAWLARSAYVPLSLAAAVLLWLVGFDTIYATQDYEFDRRHGLRSLVTRWGPQNALGVAFLAHLFTWALFVVVGLLSGFRLAYWLGLILILALLLMEHLLARNRTPADINTAFFKLNAVISLTYLVVVLCEVLFPWFRLRVY